MGWRLEGGGPATAALVRERIAAGSLETWFVDDHGRSLAVVSNGEHATTPGADGWSGGFVLANGQNDEYPDADTVPLDEALAIVERLLTTGERPPNWQVDR